MKNSSRSLWQFIQAMSKNEKEFFKRNFVDAGNDEPPLYLQLFDAIEQQKEYDEDSIIEKLAPALTRKNLSYQKHYLYQQLCEALISYEGRDLPEQEVYDQIRLIRILRKKGLLDEAHIVWKKAVVKAREAEAFALLGILKKEFEKMILWSSVHTPYDELHTLARGNIINYDDYAEMITLRDIYTEILLLKRKWHFDIDDNSIHELKLLLTRVTQSSFSDTTASFWFRHYYRMCRVTLQYLLNKNIPEAFSLLRETVSDWQQHPEHIHTDTENFIEVLNMVNYLGIQAGEFQFIEACFQHPVNDLIRDEAYRANFEAVKYLSLNKVYNKTARYNEVEKLVRQMKVEYGKWEPFINTETNRTVNLSLGIACFVLEEYADALYFFRRGSYVKDGTREEHIRIAHILLLLAAYNLNNDRIFDAQYRATYQYFYKRKKQHPFESELIRCLNRTFYMKSYRDKVAEYEKALAKLETDDEVQQKAFAIFNYPGWLRSRIERISYREYVTRRVKNAAA